MSVSSRNTRVKLYAYSDAGEDGVVNDRWTLASTRWARVIDLRGRMRMVGTSAQTEIDVSIEFADEVTIPDNALFITPDGSRYHLRYVEQRPRLRKKVAFAQIVAVENYFDACYLDGGWTLDGTSTLNGERAALVG